MCNFFYALRGDRGDSCCKQKASEITDSFINFLGLFNFHNFNFLSFSVITTLVLSFNSFTLFLTNFGFFIFPECLILYFTKISSIDSGNFSSISFSLGSSFSFCFMIFSLVFPNNSFIFSL